MTCRIWISCLVLNGHTALGGVFRPLENDQSSHVCIGEMLDGTRDDVET